MFDPNLGQMKTTFETRRRSSSRLNFKPREREREREEKGESERRVIERERERVGEGERCPVNSLIKPATDVSAINYPHVLSV